MKKPVLFGALILAALMAHAEARTLAGYWQGTLSGQRIVLKISPSGKNNWTALVTNLDQTADLTMSDPVSPFTFQNFVVKFAIGKNSYQGKLAGNLIAGAWGQNDSTPADFRAVPASVLDPFKHKILFIPVAKNVKLEVLDWGGSGPPLLFVAGLGYSAHSFDRLAPKFTARHHVYGITRRGAGNSSQPDPATGDYSADRLGEDVLAVIDALKLDRPVVAGHSISGSELSYIASRHPEKVSGLIYLDAGWPYAYYVPGNVVAAGGILGENLVLDANDLRKELEHLKTLPWQDQDLAPVIARLQILLPQFEKDLSATQTALKTDPVYPAPADSRQIEIGLAVMGGMRKYGPIGDIPALALFEDPPLLPASTPPDSRAAQNAQVEAQVDAFQAANPSARVVRLANARHALWMTNEADVIREMNAFMDGLRP